MFRRVIGIILIGVGVTGLALCYVGVTFGRDLADRLAGSLDAALASTADSLETVEATLEQSRQTVERINSTVGQVQTTTANLATAIDDSQPMLDELALLVGDAIPSTVEDVQSTIPNLAQTAKVVDDTLRLLSKLQIEETVPIINYQISVGLGVDYDPVVPFDQAVEDVGRGLDPIAEASRNLEGELATTGASMTVLSEDLNDLATSLGDMNADLAGFRPLLDEYSSLVNDIRGDVADGQKSVVEQLETVKNAMLLIAIWLALFQLLPIYFGAELAAGYRMVHVVALPPGGGSPAGGSPAGGSPSAGQESVALLAAQKASAEPSTGDPLMTPDQVDAEVEGDDRAKQDDPAEVTDE